MIVVLSLLRRFGPYALAVAVVLGALYGAYRHGVRVTEDRWSRRYVETENALLERIRATEAATAARIAELDQRHYQELQRVRTEADHTIADIRAGALRLRHRFTCPAGPVPAAPDAPGVGDGTEAGGLRREDAEFLVRIAAEADAVAVQLSACQDFARTDSGAIMSPR